MAYFFALFILLLVGMLFNLHWKLGQALWERDVVALELSETGRAIRRWRKLSAVPEEAKDVSHRIHQALLTTVIASDGLDREVDEAEWKAMVQDLNHKILYCEEPKCRIPRFPSV
jgi:phosphoribosylformimino-5-aminoimidazole carboxamide ribonucleotide (ProFAR) isomerase